MYKTLITSFGKGCFCRIYILDFLDMIEVKNVRASKIFIGEPSHAC